MDKTGSTQIVQAHRNIPPTYPQGKKKKKKTLQTNQTSPSRLKITVHLIRYTNLSGTLDYHTASSRIVTAAKASSLLANFVRDVAHYTDHK